MCVRAGRQLRPPPQSCPDCRGDGARSSCRAATTGSYATATASNVFGVWRGFCKPCRRSHGLLADLVVPHQLDTTDVIFAALDRRVVMDVPASTRRGWQARFTRNTPILRSACATAAVTFGGRVKEMRVDRLLIALWVAARRMSDMIPSPWRILNIISGGSGVRDRVNSSWPPFGAFPRRVKTVRAPNGTSTSGQEALGAAQRNPRTGKAWLSVALGVSTRVGTTVLG